MPSEESNSSGIARLDERLTGLLRSCDKDHANIATNAARLEADMTEIAKVQAETKEAVTKVAAWCAKQEANDQAYREKQEAVANAPWASFEKIISVLTLLTLVGGLAAMVSHMPSAEDLTSAADRALTAHEARGKTAK